MLKKGLKISLFAAVLAVAVFNPLQAALAQEDLEARDVGDIIDRLEKTAQDAQIISSEQGALQPTIYNFIGRFVNAFLIFLGVVFLILMMYAGFIWMMAKGKAQEIENAIKLFENGAIGLFIIIMAYIFTNFVVFKIIGIAVN